MFEFPEQYIKIQFSKIMKMIPYLEKNETLYTLDHRKSDTTLLNLFKRGMAIFEKTEAFKTFIKVELVESRTMYLSKNKKWSKYKGNISSISYKKSFTKTKNDRGILLEQDKKLPLWLKKLSRNSKGKIKVYNAIKNEKRHIIINRLEAKEVFEWSSMIYTDLTQVYTVNINGLLLFMMILSSDFILRNAELVDTLYIKNNWQPINFSGEGDTKEYNDYLTAYTQYYTDLNKLSIETLNDILEKIRSTSSSNTNFLVKGNQTPNLVFDAPHLVFFIDFLIYFYESDTLSKALNGGENPFLSFILKKMPDYTSNLSVTKTKEKTIIDFYSILFGYVEEKEYVKEGQKKSKLLVKKMEPTLLLDMVSVLFRTPGRIWFIESYITFINQFCRVQYHSNLNFRLEKIGTENSAMLLALMKKRESLTTQSFNGFSLMYEELLHKRLTSLKNEADILFFKNDIGNQTDE